MKTDTQSLMTTLALLLCLSSAAAFTIVPGASVLSSSRATSTSLDVSFGEAEGEKRRRLTEFINLEPLQQSDVRRERLEREERNKLQFAKFGNELWSLRDKLKQAASDLTTAMNNPSAAEFEEQEIRAAMRILEKQDAELVYRLELEAMEDASEEHLEEELYHKSQALNARSCLPQFNLEGLWVGKYGNHGYEMINVTYAGDTLIAYKVTGDKNVPRGEVTFQANLNPLPSTLAKATAEPLKPIMLTEKASKKWGTTQLPRYHGLGRVAEEGFDNSQWMEGQLIIIGDEYFSFAWLPIEHQIFFGRPSAELALKMLRDGGVSSLKGKSTWDEPPSFDDDVELWKDYATSCLERTEETLEEADLFDDGNSNTNACIWHGDSEECYFE